MQSNESIGIEFIRDNGIRKKQSVLLFIFISSTQQLSLGLSQNNYGVYSTVFEWLNIFTVGIDFEHTEQIYETGVLWFSILIWLHYSFISVRPIYDLENITKTHSCRTMFLVL